MSHRPESPKVSVYIANHNYGRYLEQAILSVLYQTLKNFELIVIDDGSTDNSRDIIERYRGDQRIVSIFQQNRGLNVTNNIALRAARGQFIMRLDADDFLDEHALEILSNILEREADIGLVFPDYYEVDESGNVLEIVRRFDFDQVTMLDRPAHGACTLIRRDCLLTMSGYDESLRCQDGYDLWVRFIQRYRVKNVNLPLFYYRRHPGSLTCNEGLISQARARILERQVGRNGNTQTAIAVVPVRGRSSDPNSLALRTLGDRPLIDWTLSAALNANRVSRVVVTTADVDLLHYLHDSYGSKLIVVKRHSQLARLNSPIEDAVKHALEQCSEARGSAMDLLVVLGIESPFRRSEHVDTAINLLEVFDTDCVIGVLSETGAFYRHTGSGLQPLRSSDVLRLESEELYRRAGQLFVLRRMLFESRGCLVGGRIGHLVMDRLAALRLRSEWDWETAQYRAGKMFECTTGFKLDDGSYSTNPHHDGVSYRPTYIESDGDRPASARGHDPLTSGAAIV